MTLFLLCPVFAVITSFVVRVMMGAAPHLRDLPVAVRSLLCIRQT